MFVVHVVQGRLLWQVYFIYITSTNIAKIILTWWTCHFSQKSPDFQLSLPYTNQEYLKGNMVHLINVTNICLYVRIKLKTPTDHDVNCNDNTNVHYM